MDSKEINRRQIILASGAALAAPMLAVTTPANAQGSCAYQLLQLMDSITWSDKIYNVLGSNNHMTFGVREAQPGYRFLKLTQSGASGFILYMGHRSVDKQSYIVSQFNPLTCEFTVVKRLNPVTRRCLIDVDQIEGEYRAPGALPIRPWHVNWTDGEIRMSALTHASPPTLWRWMGWIQYTNQNSGFTNTYRRMWVWDPTARTYRVIQWLYQTEGPLEPATWANAAFISVNTQINLLNNQVYSAWSRAWASGLTVFGTAFGFRVSTDKMDYVLLSGILVFMLMAIGKSGMMGVNNLSNYPWTALTALEGLPDSFLWPITAEGGGEIELTDLDGCSTMGSDEL